MRFCGSESLRGSGDLQSPATFNNKASLNGLQATMRSEGETAQECLKSQKAQKADRGAQERVAVVSGLSANLKWPLSCSLASFSAGLLWGLPGQA